MSESPEERNARLIAAVALAGAENRCDLTVADVRENVGAMLAAARAHVRSEAQGTRDRSQPQAGISDRRTEEFIEQLAAGHVLNLTTRDDQAAVAKLLFAAQKPREDGMVSLSGK